MPWIALANRYYPWVSAVTIFLCVLPGALLTWAWQNDQLGINPLQATLQWSGQIAIWLLTLSLLITPLRRWSASLFRLLRRPYGRRMMDWNWLIRLRRTVGVSSYLYGAAHAGIWLHLDVAWNWEWLWLDITEKRFLMAGAFTLLVMTPLALTSPNFMRRRMGQHWRKLHRLSYVAAVTALLHYWGAVKAGINTPYIVTVALAGLLLYRVVRARGSSSIFPDN